MNYLISSQQQFVSVSDLQRDYAAILKKLHATKKPLLVLKNNKLEAIIIRPDLFESLQEKIRQYEEQHALMTINAYEKTKKENKLTKMNTVAELFD